MPQLPETFVTPRLSARPATAADAPAVFATYANDPTVTRYLSWKAHATVESTATFLKANEEAWRTATGHRAWLLFRRDTTELAGSIGISVGPHMTMFGYVLGKQHWHRGLMPEALRFLVDWSLAQPEIHRAWAFCDIENAASARVMEKAGMTREGILRRWHVCPTIGPEPRDCIACAKVR